MTELNPCPLCGALPCDWVEDPHAYRTGNLVQIDREGMREVLARAYSQGATDVHNCWINDGGQWDADFGEAASDYAHANADAAIAAILGGD